MGWNRVRFHPIGKRSSIGGMDAAVALPVEISEWKPAPFDLGVIKLRIPVPCDGSASTGKCDNSFTSATAARAMNPTETITSQAISAGVPRDSVLSNA